MIRFFLTITRFFYRKNRIGKSVVSFSLLASHIRLYYVNVVSSLCFSFVSFSDQTKKGEGCEGERNQKLVGGITNNVSANQRFANCLTIV